MAIPRLKPSLWEPKRFESPDVSHIPVLKPREVVAILERLGFIEIRQRGSHRQYRHSDGRGTTVPFHGSRDISPSLLRKIAHDIGLTLEQLLEK
jgi:predicted RNA binding protein YcfA (HicA-like mRNA interferase family)